MNNTYSKIHSSWNTDRMGTCFLVRKARTCKPRARYLYAERCGNVVSVCDARGKKLATVTFGQEVVSAIVNEVRLFVTTADGCVRTYGAMTGELLAETWPTPPAGGSARAAFDLAA